MRAVLLLAGLIVSCGGSTKTAAPAADSGGDAPQPTAISIAAGAVVEVPVTDGAARVKLATTGAERFIVIVGSTRFDRVTGSVPFTVTSDPFDGDATATAVEGCALSPEKWATTAPPSEPQPLGAPPVAGATRKLMVGTQTIDAEVFAVSDTAVVWRDTTAARPANLDKTFVDAFLADWEKVILPRERAVFGVESDLDGDGRIGLVFSPLTYDSAVAYFSGCDLKTMTGCPAGNKGEFLYLTPPDVIAPPYNTASAMKEILAHELGHLIHFHRKVLRNTLADQPDSAYTAEGLGALAQDVIGYQAGNLYVTLAGLNSVDDFSLAPLLEDRARYDSKRDGPMRGGAYLFTRYLYDRAGGDLANPDGTITSKGGPAFMRALLDDKASVAAAIATTTGAKLDDVAMDFYTALAMSNRDAAAGVKPQNPCFAYLPTVTDPVTGKQRGADLFATFHGSKMSGPKLQPITKPSATIRFGGVELIAVDATAAGELPIQVTVDALAAPRVRVARIK